MYTPRIVDETLRLYSPTWQPMRRDTSAIYACLDLINVVHLYARDLPESARHYQQVVRWSNDLYSLEKEREPGDFHHLVLVVQHAHDIDE